MHENDDPWLATRGIDPFDQLDNYMEETVSRICYEKSEHNLKVAA